MKIKFPLQSNLVLHIETLKRYDNHFRRKNSTNRLLGLSFRSFIKVKKWSTSHYRDLMKIILQKYNVCTYLC